MNDRVPAEPVIEEGRRGFRFSLAWLVPLIALVVALGIAWQSYSSRGPTIRIMFDSAEGLTAGETLVKFRDFSVGVVESVELSSDLSEVAAHVRLDQASEQWIDADAKFWLVTARVGPQGITGLGTVLGGAYIEADFDSVIGEPQTEFTALAQRPLTPAGQPGMRVTLRAPRGGSVSAGAPILFKSIAVGTVEQVELTEDGDVEITGFVDAPHHNRITTATRFWNASGISLELGVSGAMVNVESLASLLQGGIAFDTVTSGGEVVEPGHEFRLFDSEREARVVLLNDNPSSQLTVMSYFESSVSGLQIGDAVDYRGIQVGEITELQAEVVRVDNEPVVVIRVTMNLNPSRFGLRTDGDPRDALLDLLEASVGNGMRAQLQSANILTGALRIALVELEDPEEAALDLDATPYPQLPSVNGVGGGLAESAQGVLARLENLPVEELLDAVTALVSNANRLISDESIRSAPENLGLLLADLREMVNESGLREVPAEIAAILGSVRALIEDEALRDLATNLDAAVSDVRVTLGNVNEATADLPALLASVATLADEVGELPLDEIVASASALIDSIDVFVRSDAIATLPNEAGAALAELRGILEDFRDSGATENVTATLASVRQITDELASAELAASIATVTEEARRAAESLGTASEGLPALLDSLTRTSEQVSTLPLAELVEAGTRVLDGAEVFLSSEGVEAVPPRLNAALEELTLILAELREGGTAANVNATLASADEAAAAIALAAEGLPDLVVQLNEAAERADTMLASFGPGSEINRDTVVLLNEVRSAARAVNSLVTALERRPNSVLFGR